MNFFSSHFLASAGLLSVDVIVFFYGRKHGASVVLAFLVMVLVVVRVASPYEFPTILLLRRLVNVLAEPSWSVMLRSVHGGDARDDIGKKASFLTTPRNLNDFGWLVRDGGPLGRNCSKVVAVISSTICLFLATSWLALSVLKKEPSWMEFRKIGPIWPNWWIPCLMVVFSLIVNLVLWIWSSWQNNSKGNHAGVHRMVRGTLDRQLSLVEHGMLVAWATGNAICEEVTSRGFNRWEYYLIWSEMHPSLVNDSIGWEISNLWQAMYFGLTHFNGVPSGWTGVGLTFTYGWLMGVIQDASGGLLYPILTHAVADYWIFSQIARRR
jgi:Type II CAAX prenyl endopeptidase Rce1-like